MNREEWLTNAVKPLAALINERTTLKCRPEKVRVSCGWPRLDRGGAVIGECWPANCGKGVSQLFVSPLKHQPMDVLAILLHELIHAADDCASQHGGKFVRAIKAVGLAGKPTATVCAPDTPLWDTLTAIAAELGPYPHKGFNPGKRVRKPQTTRMIKCECPDCGYAVRTTKKWIEVATPICPVRECPNFEFQLRVEVREEEDE